MATATSSWKPFMNATGSSTGEGELSSWCSIGLGGSGGLLRFLTVNNTWGVYDGLTPAKDTIYKIHSEFNRQKNNRAIMTINSVTKTTRNNNALNSYIGEITNTLTLFGTRAAADSKYKGYFASLKYDGEYVFSYIPVIDSAGIPCMHDTVSGQNFYNANTAEGAAQFIVGFETTEKAAVSLSKLPITTSGTLTVSLPAAARDTATLVPEAIDIATSRGWTIITQYRED